MAAGRGVLDIAYVLRRKQLLSAKTDAVLT
jgi:hypothetical protein